jgi:hypothetical protein
MATKLDPPETVSLKELLVENSIQVPTTVKIFHHQNSANINRGSS